MLTILILLLLAFGFYTGAKRGLILQVLYSVGYLISYFVLVPITKRSLLI